MLRSDNSAVPFPVPRPTGAVMHPKHMSPFPTPAPRSRSQAHVLRSDNSALARDCRAEIKSINAKLLKLGPR